MRWGQGNQSGDGFFDGWGNWSRLAVLRASVNHPMSDDIDFLEVAQNGSISLGQGLEELGEGDRSRIGGEGRLGFATVGFDTQFGNVGRFSPVDGSFP